MAQSGKSNQELLGFKKKKGRRWNIFLKKEQGREMRGYLDEKRLKWYIMMSAIYSQKTTLKSN